MLRDAYRSELMLFSYTFYWVPYVLIVNFPLIACI